MNLMTKTDVKELQKEFTELWTEYGKPHPNSNKYINLVKAFYYSKGFQNGLVVAFEIGAENESNI